MNDDVDATVVLAAVRDADGGSAVEATTVIRPSGPVFVDGTGRRRRRIKIAAYVAGTVCALYVGVVGVSLAAHQETSLLPLPGLGDVAGGDPGTAGILDAHDGEAQPTRTPTTTVAPLGDALKRAVAPMASTVPETSTSAPPTSSSAPTTSRTSRRGSGTGGGNPSAGNPSGSNPSGSSGSGSGNTGGGTGTGTGTGPSGTP
ncbi:hypothetical protein PSU4_60850 [Pseudonocardia sulfidoxydans NBRC 16205]|uniref:Uncharacterized protein n=1 Tax=Pseudonocardia sulfidoxydans NBRC 16205 TaxID=1223511 RepID=A0A511DQL4_9PSEU|nr:hypothetical protein [Pseudonocardia sulfidoxydans]GEL27131.1 hypothetical protein PSU4_60850 [Pseudonocardia sulfidoxydans NBRC 16205]